MEIEPELGEIKLVEEECVCLMRGLYIKSWYEVYNGKKWLGKANSKKKAVSVSEEIKKGNTFYT